MGEQPTQGPYGHPTLEISGLIFLGNSNNGAYSVGVLSGLRPVGRVTQSATGNLLEEWPAEGFSPSERDYFSNDLGSRFSYSLRVVVSKQV